MSGIESNWASVQPHHRASSSHRNPSVPSSGAHSQGEEESPWPFGKLNPPALLVSLQPPSLRNNLNLDRHSQSLKTSSCSPHSWRAWPSLLPGKHGVGWGPPAHNGTASLAFLNSMQPSVCFSSPESSVRDLHLQSEFKEPLPVLPSSSCYPHVPPIPKADLCFHLTSTLFCSFLCTC